MKAKAFKLMAALFVVTLSLGFTACGDDDDDNGGGKWGNVPADIASKIQGTWDFESGTSTFMGFSSNMTRSDIENMSKQINVSIWDLTLTFTSSTVNGARYNVEGRKLIIEGAEAIKGFEITIANLTNTTLVLRESFSYEGMTFSCDLTYEKR